VLHSICHETWIVQQWPQDRERSAFTPVSKKGNSKECSNYCTIEHISHASKVMLKILQDRLQQYENHELPDVQAEFRTGSRTRDQIANICWIIKKKKKKKKQENFRKTYASALLITPKSLTVSVQFSRSVVSDYLRPHESQHTRPPCPSPTPGVHSDSRPSSQ